jgi:hypothetical protein
MINKNSFLYWYPKIASINGIKMPKTVIFPLDKDDQLIIRANLNEFIRNRGNAIKNAIKDFHFPLFVKTDEIANKHDWKETCFVPNGDELFKHLQNLAYSSDMVDVLCSAFIFREYTPLESFFTFFHGEMPVAKERRYFIENGTIICHHPYWDIDVFEDSFLDDDHMVIFLKKFDTSEFRPPQFSSDQRNQIRRWIKILNTESPEEIALLTSFANKVASQIGGAWSVDFAYTQSHEWILIDMAVAADSWHKDSCPFATKWQRK